MVEKTSQNFLEFQSEREALSEVVAAKGEKNGELFDLCNKTAAMKQIKIASYAKDRKKLLEEKFSCLDVPLFSSSCQMYLF